ncbi:MAG: response regulator [bacterium]|nr:response regulator [bacterium]
MGKQHHILLIDDEPTNRLLIRTILAAGDYDIVEAVNGYEGLSKLQSNTDLIILDAVMPGIDGFEVAWHVRKTDQFHDLPIIMATSLNETQDRYRAIEIGINDFIRKPIDETELRLRVASLLKLKEQQDILKRNRQELEEQVWLQTQVLRQSLEEMAEAKRRTEAAHRETLFRLALAAEYKDDNTGAHLQRMSHYCTVLAKGIGLPASEVDTILHAAPMHDVGKLGIPDSILKKHGRLETDERAIMKQHPAIGARIIGGSSSELLQVSELIALTHHERWDGTGYPNGMSGKEIPLYGRIASIADVFDALTTIRPYKKAFTNQEAYDFLRNGQGSHFDPELIDVFFREIDQILAIQGKFREDVLAQACVFPRL